MREREREREREGREWVEEGDLGGGCMGWGGGVGDDRARGIVRGKERQRTGYRKNNMGVICTDESVRAREN